MMLPAHVGMGLLIGKAFNNYVLAILFSVLVDVDHVLPYLKNNVFHRWKTFWKTIRSPEDPYGNQRNYVHSVFAWIIVSAVTLFFWPSHALVVSLSYVSHLILDAMDGSEFAPFYPFRWKIVGFIPYNSRSEWVFTGMLFLLLLV